MHEISEEKIGDEEPCPYLPEQVSRMRYRVISACSTESYDAMLTRGWRRFGRVFFRPICAACHECRGLRVDVEGFRPSRSMRRTWKRNQDLRAVLRRPSLSEAHLALYERYHADMARRRGWPEKRVSAHDYHYTFVDGYESFGWELLLLRGDRLVGVSLVDILPGAVSAVYSYYEPSLRSRGLGVLAVLHLVARARERGIPYAYLGYWVEGNASMRYKIRYAPNEILRGRPEGEKAADWQTSGPTGRHREEAPVVDSGLD